MKDHPLYPSMMHTDVFGDDTPPIQRLGIPLVDSQHAALYRLIRELGVFPSEAITSRRCVRLLQAIWRCSSDHFGDEERFMQAHGFAWEQFGRHAEDHARHLNYVTQLWTGDYSDCRVAPSAGEAYRLISDYWRLHIAEYDLGLIKA